MLSVTRHDFCRLWIQQKKQRLMARRLPVFEDQFEQLTQHIFDRLDFSDECVNVATNQIALFNADIQKDDLKRMLANYVGQFLVIYLASNWGQNGKGSLAPNRIVSCLDESIRPFSYTIPFDDRDALVLAEPIAESAAVDAARSGTDVTQWVINRTDKATQKRLGMYFTPPALADYVLARTEHALQTRFDGLSFLSCFEGAQERARFQIIDPALGSGEFILALLRRISSEVIRTGYQRFEVGKILTGVLAQIRGFEIHPVALLSAHFRVQEYLSGWADQQLPTQPLRFEWKSAFELLEEPEEPPGGDILVIIGNPPFGALTKSTGTVIAGLIQGQASKAMECNPVSSSVSYFVDERGPIKERKTWLYDLYVQFFRLAHFMIDQAGEGLVGFVSNRGFIDNVTFRGMRYQLSRSFDVIEITDIGGDRRSAKKENDENSFGIETPVAISVLAKTGLSESSISYWKLEGTTANKLQQLNDASEGDLGSATNCNGEPCGQAFSVRSNRRRAKSIRLWPIDQVMPYRGSPIITARDRLVIGLGEQELRDKLAVFCDNDVDDRLIREEHFSRARSSRYQRGDTRGWSLAHVRQQLAGCLEEIDLRRCSYRPFDQRYLAWSDQLIDWPRRELMDCLCVPGNFGLVTRRQSPPELPWNYVWTTGGLTVDGVIRSDNRGNETIFPIWYKASLNFDSEFIDHLESTWDVKIDRGPGTKRTLKDESIGGEQIGAYIYALMNSSAYRQKFDGLLQTGFPPVAVARDWELAQHMISMGKKLICLHQAPLKSRSRKNPLTAELNVPKGARRVTFVDGMIRVGRTVILDNVSEATWNFKIGTHQVLKKWLSARREQTLVGQNIEKAADLLQRIDRTMKITAELDECLRCSGSWETNFVR